MRSLAPAVINPHQLHQHRRAQVALSLMRIRMEAPLSLLRPRFLFPPSREHSVFMLTSPACQACRMWRKSCQVHWILTSMLLALTVMTRPAPCRAVESSGTRMSVLLWSSATGAANGSTKVPWGHVRAKSSPGRSLGQASLGISVESAW